MNPLSYHYLIELYQCDSKLLKDSKFLKNLMKNVIEVSGATEVGNIFYEFSPHGVSGVVLISESHISIHTWPEHNYAAVDFFTCNKSVKIELAYQELIKELKVQKPSIKKIERGLDIL